MRRQRLNGCDRSRGLRGVRLPDSGERVDRIASKKPAASRQARICRAGRRWILLARSQARSGSRREFRDDDRPAIAAALHAASNAP